MISVPKAGTIAGLMVCCQVWPIASYCWRANDRLQYIQHVDILGINCLKSIQQLIGPRTIRLRLWMWLRQSANRFPCWTTKTRSLKVKQQCMDISEHQSNTFFAAFLKCPVQRETLKPSKTCALPPQSFRDLHFHHFPAAAWVGSSAAKNSVNRRPVVLVDRISLRCHGRSKEFQGQVHRHTADSQCLVHHWTPMIQKVGNFMFFGPRVLGWKLHKSSRGPLLGPVDPVEWYDVGNKPQSSCSRRF